MIYVTGDLHGEIDIRKLGANAWPVGTRLTRDDYLIVAGDFGLVWDGSDQESYWRNWLSEKPWTTLFVDGNHENFDLLEQFPQLEKWGGTVASIAPNIYWLKRGEVFEIDGIKILAFGGGMSHDQDSRTPGMSWWVQEMATYNDLDNAERNLNRHNWQVDYVISHVVPFHEVISFMPRAPYLKGFGQDRTEHILEEIKRKLDFRKWYFGHLHLDQEKGRFRCLYYNIREIGS